MSCKHLVKIFQHGLVFLFMFLICSASGLSIWEGKTYMAFKEKNGVMQVAILH